MDFLPIVGAAFAATNYPAPLFHPYSENEVCVRKEQRCTKRTTRRNAGPEKHGQAGEQNGNGWEKVGLPRCA